LPKRASDKRKNYLTPFFFSPDIFLFEAIMSFLSKSLTVLFSVSLLASMVSCSSCSKTNTVDPPKPVPTDTVVVPPVPTTQLVESHKASVTIPVVFQDQHVDDKASPNYRLFANKDAKELVSLDAEVFSSSYEEYVLEGIRFLKDRGAFVQSAVPVIINDQQMTLVESSTQGVVAYFWVTTKEGYGYTFTCGGLETSTTVKSMCSELAKTFQIK
jgi:hypothetical protein